MTDARTSSKPQPVILGTMALILAVFMIALGAAILVYEDVLIDLGRDDPEGILGLFTLELGMFGLPFAPILVLLMQIVPMLMGFLSGRAVVGKIAIVLSALATVAMLGLIALSKA